VDYDEVCAVRDLALEISPGEVYGLIGPNGAGKTTTLRALVGLVEPTYGEVYLNGVDLATHREEAVRAVGFMPDFVSVYEDLTVWEFLDLFATSYMIPREQRRAIIDQHLEMVDLTEKRDALTAGLSRGMRQRLVLAKTLLPDPAIVLLDEPAAGLDPYGRALLKDVMRRLGGEGKTVLISSHVLPELSEFCTSVGIMEKGRMVVTGRVEEVTARVMGAAEMLVEVIAGEDACASLLEGHPRVKAVRRRGQEFTFEFDGGPGEVSDLLAALLAGGVRVVSFTRKKENLEEVFLKVGAKEVS
jgi:ABC-2 type transport system ATP-binding protein